MDKKIFDNKREAGRAAARKAAELLKNAIKKKNGVAFIAATGASQFEFLEFLVNDYSIDWSKTTMFHLDEYVGIPEYHPASFRRYLKERFIDKVNPGCVYLIQGDTKEPEKECGRLNKIISRHNIDVAFVGIGENGHLAFNDPPADFKTDNPYIVVELDEKCRMQQVRESWYARLEDVPHRAISMSLRQIMKSKSIVCTVPDNRKAQAVKDCLEGEITPLHPASILQKHPNVFVFLDKYSASLLER